VRLGERLAHSMKTMLSIVSPLSFSSRAMTDDLACLEIASKSSSPLAQNLQPYAAAHLGGDAAVCRSASRRKARASRDEDRFDQAAVGETKRTCASYLSREHAHNFWPTKRIPRQAGARRRRQVSHGLEGSDALFVSQS